MNSRLATMLAVVFVVAVPVDIVAQPPEVGAERIDALEEQLAAARGQAASLLAMIEALEIEVQELRGRPTSVPGSDSALRVLDTRPTADVASFALDRYQDRILMPGLGDDERDASIVPRPELFVQTRYHANPIDEASEHDVTRNLTLSRMELRWSGRISERIGMGYELQHHPAVEGAAEELVNDAYVEYYANDALTIRVGQFVKPFGFDIQHSSSLRESPERGIFAGYFFPGQRDRGVMLRADLDAFARWGQGVTLHAGVFNGNRFFNDNNGALNYNLRLRKVFTTLPLALGVSVQRGTQILPPGSAGPDDEDIYGFDVQYVVGRLGLRAEYVRGNTPSTLLGLEPQFVPGYIPGEESSGAAALFNYSLSPTDDVYWRWDRFDNDPVTGNDARAFNVGYLRGIGPNSRIGFDYQWKNDVTFNDDELNSRFSISWNVVY